MKAAATFFISFCALLAIRDAGTHLYLSENNDPLAIVAFYCLTACIFSWLFKWYRTRSPSILDDFVMLSSNQKKIFLKLGIYTLAVYIFTIYGIKFIGASMFNFVDYGMVPIITIALAATIGQEKPARHVYIGSGVSLIGIIIFLTYSSTVSWVLNGGIVLACLSPLATSFCSIYQKQQVDSGISADIILMYRFPIPATVLIILSALFQPKLNINDIPMLAIISFCGVFIPLMLLCFGFARSSLINFSRYLFIIPIFTFIFGPILVESEWVKLKEPLVIVGIITILIGFFIAQGTIKNPSRQIR